MKLLLLAVALSTALSFVAGWGNNVGASGNDVRPLRKQFSDEFANAYNGMTQALQPFRQGVEDLQEGNLNSAEINITNAQSLDKQAYNNQVVSIANDMHKENAGVSEMKLVSLMTASIEHFKEAVNDALGEK